MKIQGPGWPGRVNPYYKNQNQDVSSSRKKDQGKDVLNISEEARALLEQNKSLEDVARRQKIEELKEKVQSGKYQVDVEKVAEKLLEWWKR